MKELKVLLISFLLICLGLTIFKCLQLQDEAHGKDGLLIILNDRDIEKGAIIDSLLKRLDSCKGIANLEMSGYLIMRDTLIKQP